MAIQKKFDVSDKYIKWLSELDKSSGPIVGGKGANLAEMYNSKMPVPPAFVVTAQAFQAFIERAGLKKIIQDIIEQTDVEETSQLEKNAKKIRNHILDAEIPKEMVEEIEEAYDILSSDKEVEKAKTSSRISSTALEILQNSKEPIFVAARSSATTEDLATASFAGQQESFTNIKGKEELIKAVKKCFASLYTARAVYYRHKKGFEKSNALLAVVVQKMVNSEKSGVMFTQNPMTLQEELVIEAVFGLGEGIVSGKILPDHYIITKDLKIQSKKIANKKIALIRDSSGKQKEVKLTEQKSKQIVLTDSEIISLANLGVKIQNHYKKPQDIEFAIDGENIYIVQSRPITTLGVDRKISNIQGEILLTGMGASPGVASGKVRIIESMEDLSQIKEGEVLVTKMTNPDMVVAMQKSSAVVTDEGGATAHAAIVSREMGLPAVVGTEEATKKLKVLTSIHNITEKPKGFYFYDLSGLSIGVKRIEEQFPIKTLTVYLLVELQSIYQKLKSNFPLYNIE